MTETIERRIEGIDWRLKRVERQLGLRGEYAVARPLTAGAGIEELAAQALAEPGAPVVSGEALAGPRTAPGASGRETFARPGIARATPDGEPFARPGAAPGARVPLPPPPVSRDERGPNQVVAPGAGAQWELLAEQGEVGRDRVTSSPAVSATPQATGSQPAMTPPPIPVAPRETMLAYERPVPRPKAADTHKPLEQIIGLKLAGWVGAIVLVIGAGFGIKFAYDQGWLGALPPTLRLTLMYIAGFGLLAAGEYVYRRINKISATGLFGAGVATLFLVSYAGHGYYRLYQRETAFALMGLSTLIGAGVAMRGRLVSIAVLSLLGGTLAPLVLRGDQSLVGPFLTYLLMLQVVALVLSWWGGSAKWWTLRGLSLASLTLWMLVTLEASSRPWGAAMWFTLLYAALYQVEVVLSARRSEDSVSGGAGVAFSVVVTAGLTAALLWIFRSEVAAVRGICVVILSAVALVAGVLLRLKRDANDAIKALAYGYRIQAAVLLLLAVPVAFSGSAISVGWAGLALALAAVGAQLRDRPTRYSAVGAWILSLLNLFIWTTNAATAQAAGAIWLTLFHQPLAAWTIIALGLGVSGHVVAFLHGLGESDERAGEQHVLSVIATIVIGWVTIAALPPLGATGVLIAYAWLLLGAEKFAPRLALLPQAVGVLAVAAVKWVVVDALVTRLSGNWSAGQYTPVLNPLMGVGVALAGSIIGMYLLRREKVTAMLQEAGGSDRAGALLVAVAVALLMTLGLTLEVDRVVEQLRGPLAWPMWQVKHMAWTVLWTIALIAVLLTFVRIDPSARGRASWRGGVWTFVALLAIKFVIVDTLIASWSRSGGQPMPLLNLQTVCALAVAGGLVVVHRILRGDGSEMESGDLSLRVALAAVGVVLWAGTLEIDRLVTSGAFPGAMLWPRMQLKHLAWTAWWSMGAVGFVGIAQWRDPTAIRRLPMLRALAAAPVALAIKYLVLDTLLFRLFKGPAGAIVVGNLQTLAGAIVFGSLILVRHFLEDVGDVKLQKTRAFAGALAVTMLVWLGSLEIDRAFMKSAVGAMFGDAGLAEQVALSIFWSAFAIGLIAAGFYSRKAALRYAGLALFAFTLFKVGVVDLRQAALGYKILSFLGLGGLLLVTSVLYGKLSPVLLREEGAIANDERT